MATALTDLLARRERWRDEGRAVVFTNGCFDLLHAGHVALLEAARACGDVLVIGLNTDASVRGLKGPDRPVVPEHERAEVLRALACVDDVVLYDDPTPLNVIETLKPDVLVKGADWAEDAIVGAPETKARGGRVVRVELVPGRSTSAIVERIRKR